MSDANQQAGGGCSAKAPFVLQVLGDSMEPEFADGAVIIVDPNVNLFDGAYIVCDYKGETTFRQYKVKDEQHLLVALNEEYDDIVISDTLTVRGVVTQQARSRKRGIKKARHYV